MKLPLALAALTLASVHGLQPALQIPFVSKPLTVPTVAHVSGAKPSVVGPKTRRFLGKILDNFSVVSVPIASDISLLGQHDVLSVEGNDLDAALPFLAHAMNNLTAPVLFLNLNVEQRRKVFDQLNLPIRHASVDSGSEMLMVDWFHDLNNGRHLRLIHLPSGLGKDNYAQSVFASADNMTRGEAKKLIRVDADALEFATDERLNVMTKTIVSDLHGYLNACGAAMKHVEICWRYMQNEFPKLGAEKQLFNSENNMIPSEGAVWRELIETNYRTWEVQWGDPFPFKDKQLISHRMNVYWYLYVQAPPHSQLYYAFVLVDSMHNPDTQLISDPAIGYTLSNLKLNIQAEDITGKGNPDDVFWIKSSPTTQNTNHEERRSWSSTDTYSLSMNLGFQGKVFSGGLKFNYTKTFTASYSESRDITDWSVIETTNPVSSLGSWQYFQQWPVDMLQHNVYDFPRAWEKFFTKPWDPCVVHELPNLSKYTLTNHNSMVWAIQPRLLSEDGKQLPVRFSIGLEAVATAVTCEIFDGHHKMSQDTAQFNDMNWDINVADLNNIQV